MAIKPEGGGGGGVTKALMARPLRNYFFAASLRLMVTYTRVPNHVSSFLLTFYQMKTK